MPVLTIDGVEVVLSALTQRPHDAVAADYLLEVRDDNRDEVLGIFRESGELGGPYRGLRVVGDVDLSFLSEFPYLLYLEIDGNKKRHDARSLDNLFNLRGLSFSSPMKGGIDFACFERLEVFRGAWHAEHRNLSRARELRSIHMGAFKPESGDLSCFVGVTRLETLRITQSNLTTIDGFEELEDLRYLHLLYAGKLEDLDAFARGDSELRELEVERLRNAKSYAPIASLRKLRRLKLSESAAMPDLGWTKGMDSLDFFSFVETNVIDGDMSPLLELPRLRYVGTMDKRHYSHKMQDLIDLLAERDSDRDTGA